MSNSIYKDAIEILGNLKYELGVEPEEGDYKPERETAEDRAEISRKLADLVELYPETLDVINNRLHLGVVGRLEV